VTERPPTFYAWLSVATSIVTITLKFAAYYLTGSVGLLSDAVEAVVNIVAALVALGVLTYSAAKPDREHNFGHEKAQYLSSGIEGALIFVAAGAIIWTAIPRLMNPQELQDIGLGLTLSVLAALANAACALVMLRAARAHRALENQKSISARLRAFSHEILIDWRFGWLLVPLGAISAILNVRRSEIMFLFIATLLIIFFWLTLTHLMGRFFVPAIPLLAMLVGFLGIDRPSSIITAATIAVMAIISFIGLHIAFNQSVNDSHAYQGLVRLRDFTELWPAQLADIEKTGGKLALIGDAQAFYRPLPMSRLEYRSIFDVVVPPEKNIVDAWLGRDLEELRKDHFILLNPGELNRLSSTYYGIPPVPPQWQRQADQTIILPPLKP